MSENLSELRVDLQATASYVNDQVTQRADTFDFDEAAGILDDLDRVIEATKLARDMVNQEMLRQLEAGDRSVEGRFFHRKPKRVERYDHDYIQGEVLRLAIQRTTDHETGEIKPADVATYVAEALSEIYVSESTKGKIGVIERLGLDKRKARQFKATGGYELEVIE